MSDNININVIEKIINSLEDVLNEEKKKNMKIKKPKTKNSKVLNQMMKEKKIMKIMRILIKRIYLNIQNKINLQEYISFSSFAYKDDNNNSEISNDNINEFSMGVESKDADRKIMNLKIIKKE